MLLYDTNLCFYMTLTYASIGHWNIFLYNAIHLYLRLYDTDMSFTSLTLTYTSRSLWHWPMLLYDTEIYFSIMLYISIYFMTLNCHVLLCDTDLYFKISMTQTCASIWHWPILLFNAIHLYLLLYDTDMSYTSLWHWPVLHDLYDILCVLFSGHLSELQPGPGLSQTDQGLQLSSCDGGAVLSLVLLSQGDVEVLQHGEEMGVENIWSNIIYE